MIKNNRNIDLLRYYFISLASLAVLGVIFKSVFVIYNYQLFSSLPVADIVYALFWGVRFDLASAAFLGLIGCLILWLSLRFSGKTKSAQVLLGIMLLIQLSLQTGDSIYYAEAGRHVSYEMRDALTDASGLFMTAVTKHTAFIVSSYLLGFIIILVTLKLYNARLTAFISKAAFTRIRFINEIKLFFILLISVIFIRGGITGIPQGVISAFKIGDAQLAIITMNGAYSVIYGALNSSKEVRRVHIALPGNIDSDKIMKSLYPVIPAEEPPTPDNSTINKYNLVFILMEGWPADRMSAYGYEKDTTPFFRSLKEKSLAPRGAIAGGVRTTEGIYAVFCSQQNPLGETVAQSSLQNFHYECLPDILKQYGWSTAFFQGTHKETSGTGAFAQSVGFTESYAREDMPAGRYEHNYWGAHDPDIYDFILDKLDTMPQPFIIGVNTNSTHDILVPPGVKPFFGDDSSEQKHESILHFADQSMKRFFEKIKTKPYYKDTVFVLVSDHTGGTHKSIAARYFVPGIIYGENIIPAKNVNRYVSQRDFAPTILELIGLPPMQSFAGKSFLHNNNDVYFADYFDAGTIGWITGEQLVETSVNRPADIKCYSLANGLLGATAVDCSDRHKASSLQSLLFTAYSQELLFTGKTSDFYKLIDSSAIK